MVSPPEPFFLSLGVSVLELGGLLKRDDIFVQTAEAHGLAC